MLLLNSGKKLLMGLLFLPLVQTAGMCAQQVASATSVQAPASGGQAAAQDTSKVSDSRTNKNDNNNSDHKDGKKEDKGYTAQDGKTPPVESSPVEDFNTLAVPAGLSFGAEIVDKFESPDFSKELIRAAWRVWDPIDVWVIKPAGVKKPPVILYLNSFPSTNDRYYDPDYCKFVTKNGFVAVGFVSALTGDRYHDRPMKQWFVSELQESLATSVHDVQLLLNYLGQRGDLDMTRVGMVGDGSGASIAIMAAAVDPRIQVLDLVNPWGDWPDWLAKSSVVPEDERTNYLKPEFLKKVENVDPVKWLPELKSQRVRLTYVESVKATPKEVRDRVEAAAPRSVKIANYQDTEDFVTEVTSSRRAFDWIKEQLRPSASAQTVEPNSNPEAANFK